MKKIFPARIQRYFVSHPLSPRTKKVLKIIKILFVATVSLIYLPISYGLLSFASFSSDPFYVLVCGMVLSPLITFWGLFFYRKYLLTLGVLLYLFTWMFSVFIRTFPSGPFLLSACVALSPLIIFWGLFFYRKHLLIVGILLYLFTWMFSALIRYQVEGYQIPTKNIEYNSVDNIHPQNTVISTSAEQNIEEVNKIPTSMDTSKEPVRDDTFKIVQTNVDTSLVFKNRVIKKWIHASDKNPFFGDDGCLKLTTTIASLSSLGLSDEIQRQKAWDTMSKSEQNLCVKENIAKKILWKDIGEGFFEIKRFFYETSEGWLFDTNKGILINGFGFGNGRAQKVYVHSNLFGFVIDHLYGETGNTISFYDRKLGKVIKEWNTDGTESIIITNIKFIDSRKVEISFRKNYMGELEMAEPEESVILDLY